MTRAEKAQRIVEILDALHPEVPIPLDHHDAYTLMVAVMLSAQTTDKKVNEITPALFARADTPQKMATVPVAELRHLIRQIGLAPTKAKNLGASARMLLSDFGGEVPADLESLERLPGVGHKTAQVVMSQAFGVPSFPVDTHIHRLAARWGLSSGRNVVQTERDLKRIFDRRLWNRLHLQMIYFGRQHCPARGHDLSTCPICGWAATKKRRAEELQKNRPKRRAGKSP